MESTTCNKILWNGFNQVDELKEAGSTAVTQYIKKYNARSM